MSIGTTRSKDSGSAVHSDDRTAYTAGKSALIEDILYKGNVTGRDSVKTEIPACHGFYISASFRIACRKASAMQAAA